MKDKMLKSVEEYVSIIKELYDEEVEKDEIEMIKSLVGECGVLLWIDSDLGYDSGLFVIDDNGEMFGFEGNNGELKKFRLDKESVIGLLCYVLNV